MRVIGKAYIKNIDTFLQWRKKEGKTWLQDNWNSYFTFHRNNTDLLSYAEKGYSVYGSYINAKLNPSFDEKVVQHNEYLSKLHMAWDLLYYDDFLVVIQSANFAFALPVSMVKIEEYENLDNYTIEALRGRTGDYTGPGLVPNQALSIRQMKSRMEEAEAKIGKQKEKMKSLQEEKEEELRRMRDEIEKRYEEKMQTLKAKEEEMLATMERLKNELFLLDTEIYSIRCFLGEIIDFIPIVSGQHAAKKEPVVLYQKMRYLDEEMGKYLAVYDFDDRDSLLFEEALQHRKDLQNIFAPGPKSVSLVRISRNSVQYGQNEKTANMLKAYETFHGKRIGILLRDGENIWIGWTDDDRISIRDENAFFEPRKEYEALDANTSSGSSSTKEEIASRYFIFSILQGVLTHGKTICLPDETNLFKKNSYVIFSMADGWLEDNRFGQFSDIVAVTNGQPLKVGDIVLTTMHITRDDKYNRGSSGLCAEYLQPWNNNRGRGIRNRTYNASLSNRELYPVNCIDVEETFYICGKRYTVAEGENDYRKGTFKDNFRDSFTLTNHVYHGKNVKNLTEEELFSFYLKEHEGVYYRSFLSFYDTHEIEIPEHIERGETTYHYFLSAKRSNGYEISSSRANMEIMEDEYLNLTYLNSIYVLYAIQNRKVGGWKVGNQYLDYANSLPYLHKALEYLREREKEEAEMLQKYIPLYPDWQVDLSEWRMKQQFHRLTDKRAKKFAAFVLTLRNPKNCK